MRVGLRVCFTRESSKIVLERSAIRANTLNRIKCKMSPRTIPNPKIPLVLAHISQFVIVSIIISLPLLIKKETIKGYYDLQSYIIDT